MAQQTLYDKLWRRHVVHCAEGGTALIYIDRHLVHKVTSPQAFEGLHLAGRRPWRAASVLAREWRVGALGSRFCFREFLHGLLRYNPPSQCRGDASASLKSIFQCR